MTNTGVHVCIPGQDAGARFHQVTLCLSRLGRPQDAIDIEVHRPRSASTQKSATADFHGIRESCAGLVKRQSLVWDFEFLFPRPCNCPHHGCTAPRSGSLQIPREGGMRQEIVEGLCRLCHASVDVEHNALNKDFVRPMDPLLLDASFALLLCRPHLASRWRGAWGWNLRGYSRIPLAQHFPNDGFRVAQLKAVAGGVNSKDGHLLVVSGDFLGLVFAQRMNLHNLVRYSAVVEAATNLPTEGA
mmetsp:Transcript_9621/g.17273  ORF Transcript_9621/g.17273 Transcript_9621/m.17273 type:complete len:244 (+) Transcript_9621:117-848(+)